MDRELYLFLLGIPGCGKSEIYHRLSQQIMNQGIVKDCERLDDYPILWEYFQNDGPKTEPCEDGGYLIVDDTLWDDVLCDLDRKCRRQAQANRAVFIEFARGDNRSALENFSAEIMDRAILIYIYCPFDEAWRRNVERHEQAIEEGTDDHMVSREEMKKTYGNDDHEQLLNDPPAPTIRIDNDRRGLEYLEPEIERASGELRERLPRRNQ